MFDLLRRIVLGSPHTRPPRESTRQGWKKHWWRYPGEYVKTMKWWPPGDEGVLVRTWFLFGVPPGWKLLVHCHESTDPLPHGHSHSGRLLSLILWGGYIDERVDGRTGRHEFKWHKPLSFNWLPEYVYHRIHTMPKGKAITLCLIFPNIQEQGWYSNGEYTSMGRYFGEQRHLTST